MWVWSLHGADPLEKEIAIHSSIHAWEILWTKDPGGLQSMGSCRVGHDWSDLALTHTSKVLNSLVSCWTVWKWPLFFHKPGPPHLGVPPAQVCAVMQAWSSGLGQVKGPLDTEAPADLVSVEGLWPPPCRVPHVRDGAPFSEKGIYFVMAWSNHDSLLKAPPNVMGLSSMCTGGIMSL